MQVTQEEGARPVKAWTTDIEPEAMQQLRNCARMPFVLFKGIAAMPDVHYGIGATASRRRLNHRRKACHSGASASPGSSSSVRCRGPGTLPPRTTTVTAS